MDPSCWGGARRLLVAGSRPRIGDSGDRSEGVEVETARLAARREHLGARILRGLFGVQRVDDVEGAVAQHQTGDVDLGRLRAGSLDGMVRPRDDEHGVLGVALAGDGSPETLVAPGPDPKWLSGRKVALGVTRLGYVHRPEVDRTIRRLLSREDGVRGDAPAMRQYHELIIPIPIEVRSAERLAEEAVLD